MGNRLTWIAGGLGLAGAGAYRALRRRRSAARPVPGGFDPRADELRRKLAESRDLVSEREEFEAAETPVDRAEPAGDIEQRRGQVHRQARAAVDEMRTPPVSGD